MQVASRSRSDPQTPRWFYNFFRVYTFFTLVMLGLLYVDFFRDLSAPDSSWGSVGYRLVLGFVVVPGGIAISLLVLRRTERNVTGLFLLMFATMVMTRTLRIDSPLNVLNNVIGSAAIGLFLLPLYFPDGTTYPLRWQGAIRIHSMVTSTIFAGIAVFQYTLTIPTGFGQVAEVPNPLFLPALTPVADVLGTLQALTWFSVVLWIIPSIVLRYRASRGVTRQQIKLFVYGFGFLIGTFVPFLVFVFPSYSSGQLQDGPLALVSFLWDGLFFAVMPFAVIGYAILRHRLYDIDVIIRRTLTYTVVTAVLAMTYFGGVVLMQSLFESITGEQSPLAIVATTLLIAALFNPLRRRVQDIVDRRFNRSSYDMQQALDHFNEQMRDEVEIESIETAIIDLVQETMEPAQIGLWLTEPNTSPRNT